MSELTRRQFVSTLAGVAGTMPARAIAPRPRLLVLLIAEQFRSDYLTRFNDLFVPGGFRRLIEEGSYWPDCRMNASSFSASGLATIATGAYPQAHGIVAESWLDGKSGEIVPASAAAFEATTLADQIALESRNRVFALGMDRTRASLAVRNAQAILTLATGDAGPEWVTTFRQQHSPDRFKNAKWHGMLAEPGAPPLRTLIDDPAHPEEFAALYNASPFAQETQFELLRTALAEEKLGQGSALDFAAAVFSPMALLGYEVGADSPLMREMVLHFDRQIELTLDALRKQPGAGNFALAFTSAHGSPNHNVKPVSGEPVARAVNEALVSAYDVASVKGRWVDRYVYPFLYLNHRQLRRYGIDPRQARRLAGDTAILSGSGVAAYYTADGDCSSAGDWRRRFENSFHAVRSGDLMLAYEPNAVEAYDGGRGISYGSFYNYDIQTPLILHGPPFRAATIESPVESVDIAPTLARALRVSEPSSSTGRVLGQAFVPGRDKAEK